ncbi:hypothetical protein PCASD_23742 [Puccinia coronata f. sp. avenae]|uniref:Uncharacterized protein n=1 Tax=Puccinia coronata f. sp. avenae TaxID=200324 RepID=A0A2N5SFQ7_9BASI|nr:hypothetical protein PCASD_23742 [Puccinia coronata f. sp. avenae]
MSEAEVRKSTHGLGAGYIYPQQTSEPDLDTQAGDAPQQQLPASTRIAQMNQGPTNNCGLRQAQMDVDTD